jgi:hypothetical protein
VTGQELEAIRGALGYTQERMAERLACDFVGYRRYATGSRPVPRYIARSAVLLEFIRANSLQQKLDAALDM